MITTYEDLKDKDFEELLTSEARIVVARNVGINHDPRLRFGLADLNAIYGYITGDWYFEKREYGTARSPDSAEVRAAIADEVGFEDDEYPSAFDGPILRKIAETVEEKPDDRPRVKV